MQLSLKSHYFSDTLDKAPIVIGPLEGETLEVKGIRCQFKITSELSNDQLGVYEITLQPRTIGAGLHFHRFMDETFVVLKGILTIKGNDSATQAKEGTVVHVPRFTPHSFSNESEEETKILLVFTPAQNREGFFRGLFQAIGENALGTDAFRELYERYDSLPLKPSH